MRLRCYKELQRLQTFEERFEYLKLEGNVGLATFGFDRWMNQQFYASREWKHVRELVILRDNGQDLGLGGYEIHTALLIHHMNPITPKDIADGEDWILDPQYLITTTLRTHNAIHYGNKDMLRKPYVERKPGDTAQWASITSRSFT